MKTKYKYLSFAALMGIFSISAMADSSSLIERLKNVTENQNFVSSNGNRYCDLHVESDLESTPPQLIGTWTSFSGIRCNGEGETFVVACKDGFMCGKIYLLPDGNFVFTDFISDTNVKYFPLY